MVQPLRPTASQTLVHPFSAISKDFQNPDFSLESRSSRTRDRLEVRPQGLWPSLSMPPPAMLDDGGDDNFMEGWLADAQEPKKLPQSPEPDEQFSWTTVINRAIMEGQGHIGLDSRGLTYIPYDIQGLSMMIRMDDAPAVRSRLQDRSGLERSGLERSGLERSGLGRTKSGPLLFGAPSAASSASSGISSDRSRFRGPDAAPHSPIKLFLSKNAITSDMISDGLFFVTNLNVLSLRDNALTFLPPSVGRLTNLEELNVGMNRLTFLPAELLRLPRLKLLIVHPNPLLLPPTENASPSGRLLGPLVVRTQIPSLREYATRVLLDTDPESPNVMSGPAKYIETFIRQTGYTLPAHLMEPFYTTLNRFFSPAVGKLYRYDPLGNICFGHAPGDTSHVFYTHAVERVEWVSESCLKDTSNKASHIPDAKTKPGLIPILHRGCSLHCLDWLER